MTEDDNIQREVLNIHTKCSLAREFRHCSFQVQFTIVHCICLSRTNFGNRCSIDELVKLRLCYQYFFNYLRNDSMTNILSDCIIFR